MIAIQVTESTPSIEIADDVRDRMERVAQEVLRHTETSPSAGLSLVISDDLQIQSLNRQYLGVDAPTDVLAFPSGEIDLDSGQPYLGDVIISYQRAEAQSQAGGHTLEQEIQLLIVHGVLHLLGFDHATDSEKTEMWKVQDEILAQLGSPITSPLY
ncbi:MAG: rRNA maturation RNase YbeY [Anaerolineales bacterium]|jgi:probable rRNA maturation factor